MWWRTSKNLATEHKHTSPQWPWRKTCQAVTCISFSVARAGGWGVSSCRRAREGAFREPHSISGATPPKKEKTKQGLSRNPLRKESDATADKNNDSQQKNTKTTKKGQLRREEKKKIGCFFLLLLFLPRPSDMRSRDGSPTPWRHSRETRCRRGSVPPVRPVPCCLSVRPSA